jgi:O-methyltransferase
MVRELLRKVGIYKYPRDFTPAEIAVCERVRPFTMTTPERVQALIDATRYVVARSIPGAIVECGVWKGGSMMASALTLSAANVSDRDLYLFDTYDGMTAPGPEDVDLQGVSAEGYYKSHKRQSGGSDWCAASVEEVKTNIASTNYPAAKIHFVKGKVEETIPGGAPAQIALLRLDTDWYESTKHTLEHLYPRLAPGGVLMIDDYGHWKGSRQATDEYFSKTALPILLGRVDYTGRMGVKV